MVPPDYLQNSTARDIEPASNALFNLAMMKHLPVQHFTAKDQHLLKPPPVMAGGFGRRASDGGAYLQMYSIEDGDESEGQTTRNPHSVHKF